MADAVEERRSELVAVADRETGLGPQRLGGELTRTAYQLRLFADVLDDGAYLEATIDHAGPTPMGPRPDLRRILLPLGPVAVFGASNFPFAFSVPGGDTASALAAGCPVIAKVHGAHPATSILCRDALLAGARAAGVTSPVVSLVFGREAGTDLVAHEAITAVGFTGSLDVGRMLADLAAARPSPIPFYGELGALNTFLACPAAARDRGAEIGAGLAVSFTLGVGQFCTKPGVAVIPAGPDGDAIRSALVAHASASSSGVMLSERTALAYAEGTERLATLDGVEVLARGAAGPESGWWGAPLLLRATPEAVQGPLTDECFGPVIVLVEYTSADEIPALLGRFGPALTATVHADEGDHTLAAQLLDLSVRTVGRVVWNGYPTGVAVSWAMHHGGPYPATTNALHTSVGTSAIRRWLRPVSLQDVPEELLPDELRDSPSVPLPRRVDGVLVLP
jgi:NADP-dependent aldehyde dehydrogenase